MDTEVPQWLTKRGRPRLNSREDDDVQVLQVIIENPEMTRKAIAEKLGWIRTRGVGAGQPHWVRVLKAIERLRNKGQLR